MYCVTSSAHKKKTSISTFMKTIMKKFILAAFALMVSVSMFAQQPQRGERREFKPEEMATRQAEYMKKELSLDDKQYKSVHALFLKRNEEMKAQFANRQEGQQVDRETRRAEMIKKQDAMDTELKKILTSEQYAKYKEMQKKEQERRKQGGPRGPHGGPGMSPRQ
jgi:CHASE1-domain containing sensor protein